jgi:enoyl-CoA hydratase/carnithine racemase
MSDPFIIDAAGPVARITLNRPQEGNILTLDAVRALTKTITELGMPSDRRAILLSGAGSDFCLGRDTQGGGRSGEKPTALQLRAGLIAPILDLYRALRETPVPVIAIVQGRSFGLGCALVSACDVAIASGSARFKLPEMEKDLPPTLAMSALLQRVPPKTIAYLVYSMAEIDASVARMAGIVSHVVPESELTKAGNELGTTLSRRAPAAVKAVKEYLRSAIYMDASGAADLAGISLANVLASA